jgi:hypothetical protein
VVINFAEGNPPINQQLIPNNYFAEGKTPFNHIANNQQLSIFFAKKIPTFALH